MENIKSGGKAPDFTYNTAYETDKNFYAQLSEKGNLLIFSRYIGCSICLMKLMEIKEAYKEFEEIGVKVFFVMQSKAETALPKLEELKIPFDVILDPEETLYRLYNVQAAKNKLGLFSPKLPGLLKKAKEMGITHGEYEGNELQLPAVFVLDGKAIVRHAHYSKDLCDFPDTERLAQLLKR